MGCAMRLTHACVERSSALDMKNPSKPIRAAAIWCVPLVLLLAILACTSNDTMFIKLTATPMPTTTPTPLAAQTRYKVGDKLYLVDTRRVTELPDTPGAKIAPGSNLATCFRDTVVNVLEASLSMLDKADTTIYYKVSCGASGQGWLPEYYLSVFGPNSQAKIQSPDGKGAPIYKEASFKSALVKPEGCPDGTTVRITTMTRNLDLRVASEEKMIFTTTNCEGTRGYIPETMLVPVK